MNVLDLFSNPFLYVRVLWVISVILVLWMSRQRLSKKLKQEWDINYQFAWPFRKNIVHTLAKLYIMLENTNSIKLAEYVRLELCSNASIAFQKSTSYFIRHRENKVKMREFFDDEDLLNFFADPKLWCLHNGGIKYSAFRLKKEVVITSDFLKRLTYIITSFRGQLHSQYPRINAN